MIAQEFAILISLRVLKTISMLILVLVTHVSQQEALARKSVIILTIRESKKNLKSVICLDESSQTSYSSSSMRIRRPVGMFLNRFGGDVTLPIFLSLVITYTIIIIYSQPGIQEFETQLRKICCNLDFRSSVAEGLSDPFGTEPHPSGMGRIKRITYCENGILSITNERPMSFERFCKSQDLKLRT